MGITAIIDVHEAVLRAAREKEKSYDEAVKEFLEVSDEVILNRKKEVFDRVVTNMTYKKCGVFKKGPRQIRRGVSKCQRKTQESNQKNFSTGLRPTCKPAEDKKNIEYTVLNQ